jgi:hypothetical protein
MHVPSCEGKGFCIAGQPDENTACLPTKTVFSRDADDFAGFFEGKETWRSCCRKFVTEAFKSLACAVHSKSEIATDSGVEMGPMQFSSATFRVNDINNHVTMLDELSPVIKPPSTADLYFRLIEKQFSDMRHPCLTFAELASCSILLAGIVGSIPGIL